MESSYCHYNLYNVHWPLGVAMRKIEGKAGLRALNIVRRAAFDGCSAGDREKGLRRLKIGALVDLLIVCFVRPAKGSTIEVVGPLQSMVQGAGDG